MEPFVAEKSANCPPGQANVRGCENRPPCLACVNVPNFWSIEIIPEVEFAVNCLFDGSLHIPQCSKGSESMKLKCNCATLLRFTCQPCVASR